MQTILTTYLTFLIEFKLLKAITAFVGGVHIRSLYLRVITLSICVNAILTPYVYMSLLFPTGRHLYNSILGELRLGIRIT